MVSSMFIRLKEGGVKQSSDKNAQISSGKRGIIELVHFDELQRIEMHLSISAEDCLRSFIRLIAILLHF